MTDQEDKNILGKIAFDDNTQERKSWACLEQTCSRSVMYFRPIFSKTLLSKFGCFWRTYLPKACGQSTVRVGILCRAAGYILPSPKQSAS